MFTLEEKRAADRIKKSMHSLYSLRELDHYLQPRYFSFLDSDISYKTITRVPIGIPKQIVLFWNDKILPEDAKQSIQSIQQHNEGYQVKLFDSEMARDFIKLHYGAELCGLYDRRCLHPAMQSDLFRICYLLQEGGIYVDVDIHCYASLDNIYAFQDIECLLLYSKSQPSCINNDFIICEPKNSVIAAILVKIQENLTRPSGFSNVWACTGPGPVSIAIFSLLMEHISKEQQKVSPLGHLTLGADRLAARAYNHAELDYKKDPNRNWRYFQWPANLEYL